MKKLLISLLCVFLALVLIGVTSYSKLNFQETIDEVKNDISPVFTAFSYVSGIVQNILHYGDLFDKDTNIDDLDILISQSSDIYSKLSLFLPDHIYRNNLHDRCSRQSWNIFTSKTDFHEDKICLFQCFLDAKNKSKFLNIGFCGVCNEIVFITGAINNSGMKYIYPFDKSGGKVGYINFPWVSDTFLFEDVEKFLGGLIS